MQPTARSTLWLVLFCDHAARDPVAGIAGWVGLHVISLGVNHERGAAVREHGMTVGAEGHVRIVNRRLGGPVLTHREVLHVSSVVPVGIFQSVLLVIRIEVGAR